MRMMLKLLVFGALPAAAAPLALAAPLAGPLHLAAEADAPAIILTRAGPPDAAGAVWQSEAGGDDGWEAKDEGDPEAGLAAELARLEVYVGIRVEQMNAWRDYTAALQDLLAPRHKLEDLHEPSPFGPPGPKDPFDREQKLAEEFGRRGQAAERLAAAIDALRTTLTPAQLERLARADRSKWLRIPQGPFGKAETGG